MSKNHETAREAIAMAIRVLVSIEDYNDDDLACDLAGVIAEVLGPDRVGNVGWGLTARSDGVYRPRVLALARRDGAWSCHYCAHSFSDERPPAIEHVFPRSRGGSNEDENLVLSCADCNARKHTSTPLEWLGDACCDVHA